MTKKTVEAWYGNLDGSGVLIFKKGNHKIREHFDCNGVKKSDSFAKIKANKERYFNAKQQAQNQNSVQKKTVAPKVIGNVQIHKDGSKTGWMFVPDNQR